MSVRAIEPTYFASPRTPGELITFKYFGGKYPGTVRTVRFASWFWAWGELEGHGEGYMQAYDLDGVYKTYLYSKMSKIGCALIPPCRSNYETQEETLSNSEQNSNSEFLSKLSQGDRISFKYSGGSWPGVLRTLFFHSWYNAGPVRGAYMTACNSNGNFKTFHCTKISHLSLISQSNSETEKENENNLSNWTSWIKQGDIIEFTYMEQTHIRNVKFIEFMNRNCVYKRKILCYEDPEHGGYTKTFFIDKMKIHKIFEGLKLYENSISSPQELHNEIKHLESKQELLCKEMKAHIDSQNITIEELKKKCYELEKKHSELEDENSTLEEECLALQKESSVLEEECYSLQSDYSTFQEKCHNLEDQVQHSYSIMNTHKKRYPSTWESDFVPKELSGWEVINPPTSE
jgi:DNA repair exonuclease SbcCD ATPase subunit